MKKLLMILSLVCTFTATATTVTDVYDLTLSLQIPQVLNNSQSLGVRKYKTQKIKGKLTITYVYDKTGYQRPVIDVTDLVNQNFKVGGSKVTYKSTVNDNEIYSRLVLIGDNKTEKFKTASTCFYVEAEPSYNKGEMDEDNGLYILLAGKGSTDNKGGNTVIANLKGYVTGTLGCGCMAYGHISPTRMPGPFGATDIVDDVACVFGSWSAKWKTRIWQYTDCCK